MKAVTHLASTRPERAAHGFSCNIQCCAVRGRGEALSVRMGFERRGRGAAQSLSVRKSYTASRDTRKIVAQPICNTGLLSSPLCFLVVSQAVKQSGKQTSASHESLESTSMAGQQSNSGSAPFEGRHRPCAANIAMFCHARKSERKQRIHHCGQYPLLHTDPSLPAYGYADCF